MREDGGLHAGVEARDVGPLTVKGATTNLFELLRGTHRTLLLVPGTESEETYNSAGLREVVNEVTKTYGDLVRVCFVMPVNSKYEAPRRATIAFDVEGAPRQRYGAAKPRLYLIRPDGYIGFRGSLAQVSALTNRLSQIFIRVYCVANAWALIAIQ